MRLLKLSLHFFQGIKDYTIEPNGEDINILGDNGTGKTTLFNAFLWLLFGKDSQGKSDFAIKTLDENNQVIPGLDHAVEGVFEINGKTLVLRKVYAEKWTKKRGSVKPEVTGHTTDYFLDGVPVQKKEYDAYISEIADEAIFKLLTSPLYFNEQLHWQKRRELLLQVCGDVSDAEVIASKAELGKLAEILGNRTIEQHRKVIQARRTEINRELEKIPVRIDEVKRSLPDISDIANEKELPQDIAKLREELRAKQEELAQVRAGGAVAEKTKELRLIEGQILDLKNKHRATLNEKIAGKSNELIKIQNEINKLKVENDARNRAIQHNEMEIKFLEEKMETLRKGWYVENSKVFEYEQSETCPTCGQPLPQERLQAARDKALAQFNKAKAEKLEAIRAEGNKLKDMKTAMEENLAYVRRDLEKAKADLADMEKKEAALKAEIEAIMQGAEPVESTVEYYQLNAKHRDLQDEIRKLDADSSLAIAAVQKEIDSTTDAIAALEQAAARLQAHKNGLKRIEELKAEERKLAAEYEDLERQIYLTEEFIRAKVRLLEDRINSRFQMARFKLFEVQVNGGVNECCETLYGGVPYSSGLNNAARINVGLDIINTLSEHYGFAPPIFVDNAEAVTQLIKTRGQMIRLIVSEPDKKLRVEVEK
ncbi:MAG: AAA family ATPase [Firmicutes bacterium]|nr:AAA family ATPase [Bacillota bacterium]